MSSAVAELETGLQAMLSLRPPGVSGSKIKDLTALCDKNIQSESVLIQKLYTHFKKAPGTHKLGVLYVVDSVTRRWSDQAKSAGQPINGDAKDGTYAAGVHRVKELLPVLMNDIIVSAPDDQKEKLKKLIDIWEKGQTFPLAMLTGFKDKLIAETQNTSHTPPGSPPSDPLGLAKPSVNPVAAASNTSSILAALANMARQNTAAAPAAAGQTNAHQMSNPQGNAALPAPVLNQSVPYASIPPPVNMPAAAAPFYASPNPGQVNGTPSFASNQMPFPPPPPLVPGAPVDPAMQQLMLIKTLTDAGLAPDKIAGIVAGMGAQGGFVPPPPPPPQYLQNVPNPNSSLQNGPHGWGVRNEETRDRNGHDGARSPPGQYRRRSRSRSPVRGWSSHDSPARRRDDPRDSPGRGRDEYGRDRGGNGYRQRSPPRRSLTPPSRNTNSANGAKWVGYDDSIPNGSIKVLSRTLFVGGVTCSEQELRSLFARHGEVQTCIANKDKRHAFVKMMTRADAVHAKDAMEQNRSPDSQLRTRWGVGFGPRDCSDYATGISVIPISKLTDADKKWMLNAECGGSGGKPIESGMVVEEPDIEIGQGVSSKAISRRMQAGDSNGPKSRRDYDSDDRRRGRGGGRDDRRDDRRDDDRKDYNNSQATNNAPPSMPPIPSFGNFPFQFPTLPNGMPMMPPGFFPGQPQGH